MSVHFMANGEIIVDAVRVEEGEIAQRDTTGTVGEPPARNANTVVAARHNPRFADERQHGQCHHILWQLPKEEEDKEKDEYQFARHGACRVKDLDSSVEKDWQR